MDRPDPLFLPTRCNPLAIDQWFSACQSLPHDSRSAWLSAISTYTDLCEQAGLLPFVVVKNRNAAAQNFLYSRRRRLIRYLDLTKLTVGLPLKRGVQRSATVTEYGFEITVQANFIAPDRAWVEKLFSFPAGLRFTKIRDKDRRYVYHVDPSVAVFVYNDLIDTPTAWHIGYTIKCPINVLAESDPEKFILQKLWVPLSNKFRPVKTDIILHL